MAARKIPIFSIYLIKKKNSKSHDTYSKVIVYYTFILIAVVTIYMCIFVRLLKIISIASIRIQIEKTITIAVKTKTGKQILLF